jgi:hypothetical protein
MYTQWEHGRTYLYVEREGANLTAVDLTRKYTPRIVDHQPEQVASPRYQLVEGGPIEVTPSSAAQAGIDNVRDRGTLSVLQATNPRDSELLQFFGPNSSNLVDRDRRLIFFAYPTRLLIVEDDRWYGVDYSIN